jgi:hypothetical protein
VSLGKVKNMEFVQSIGIIVVAATLALWINDKFQFAEFVIDDETTEAAH